MANNKNGITIICPQCYKSLNVEKNTDNIFCFFDKAKYITMQDFKGDASLITKMLNSIKYDRGN